MPTTPRFAIPFPCEGDVITAASFQAFAMAIEAAAASVDAVKAVVLSRPSAFVVNTVGQNITVATTTTFTYDTELWDTDNMSNLAVNNDRLTVVTNGVYMLNASTVGGILATTVTATSLLFTKNGTVFATAKNDAPTGYSTTLGVEITALVSCVAGDILRTQIRWEGTGGPVAQSARFGARLVCKT
jgi:hypothetical protein